MTERPAGELEVLSLSRRDSGLVVPCLVRAFWDFPETRHLLGAEPARRRVLPRLLGSDARDAARFGTLQAVRDDQGRVVGAAAWLPPGAYPVSWGRQAREGVRLLPVLPWGLGALREVLRGQEANRRHHRALPPHFWLRAVGVEPARQHEGIGSMLVRGMLARADAEGKGCFLFTATDENARWYRSSGFDVIATYHPTPTWPKTWAMWRGPADTAPRMIAAQ